MSLLSTQLLLWCFCGFAVELLVVGDGGVGHPNVHYLNLMNNDIGDEGAEAIGELLKENKGIVEMVRLWLTCFVHFSCNLKWRRLTWEASGIRACRRQSILMAMVSRAKGCHTLLKDSK